MIEGATPALTDAGDTEPLTLYRYRIVSPKSTGRWQDEGTTLEQVQDSLTAYQRFIGPRADDHTIERQALGPIEAVPATSAQQSAEQAHHVEPRAPRP